MGELRKDYILDRYVIIASERGKRPHQFAKETAQPKCPTPDFFAPGNENMTPPEIMRVENDDPKTKKRWPWKIRVFPNKFMAVKEDGNAEIKTDNQFYTFSDNFGKHEVIVETPDCSKQLWDLDISHIKQVIDVYCRRITEIRKIKGIKYVCIFKNNGKEAGTSIVHSHSQVIAYNKIPEIVRQKVEASKKYPICPYCSLINNEKQSFRRCFENHTFVAFAPYASRFPFEVLILPKAHVKDIVDLDDGQKHDLADIMKNVLLKLKELNAPFNYVIHNAPQGENMHFQIEILPRLTTWAGFEMSGTVINPMPPEDAAKFYRGEE
ncbi:MAG: galactose-1-phosphate uridylyltransferase [Nanoarchaeota archaeon]|nr:galactose-1-phosphate uridylyltransferase [Nanoarchaeota archaeon]